MPPRYAYWTILVDDQPTAFRSGSQEDLLPTFKRLKEKHPSAVMKWFQNGKLWESRIDAQEAMRARGELGRRGDERQAGRGFRDRDRRPARDSRDGGKRSAWTPRGEPSTPAPKRNADDKLDWKPKGEFTPAPKRSDRSDWKPKTARADWAPKSQAPSPKSHEKREWKPKTSRPQDLKTSRPSEKPEWKPKSFKRPDFKRSGDDTRSAKPEWKPKGTFDRERKPKGSYDRERKPAWKPKGEFSPAPRRSERTEWRPKSQAPSPKSQEKLDWKPKGEFTPAPKRSDRTEWNPKSQAPSPTSPEKRKWVPKADYKKSLGIEARKDKNWRPGGEHKDPRQKYKDAKKAKWTKFKKTIRTKWEAKGKKKS